MESPRLAIHTSYRNARVRLPQIHASNAYTPHLVSEGRVQYWSGPVPRTSHFTNTENRIHRARIHANSGAPQLA